MPHAHIALCPHTRACAPCTALEFEIEMLRREAKILQRLSHPRIPQCYDYIEELGNCYLVLPMFTKGDMLERLMKMPHYRFTEPQAKAIMRDITHTLVYLHKQGVVHRDLKRNGCSDDV